MIETLVFPFSYPFMREAALIAVIVAVPAALLSCFLVLRGWSLMGDAVAHSVLPGVVVAYILGWPLLVGAFVAGLGCAVTSGWIEANSRVKSDTVLGVVMSGMFGLGIVIYTAIPSDVHLKHVLFGNILGVGRADFIAAVTISAAISAILILKWRDFGLLAFDPVQARVSGLPVRLLHYGLLAMIAASVVAMLTAVGLILSVALLIAPAAVAFLLTRRLAVMLVLATVTATACSLAGVWTSFWLDSAPAPTIVLFLTACFIAAFISSQIAARLRARSRSASTTV